MNCNVEGKSGRSDGNRSFVFRDKVNDVFLIKLLVRLYTLRAYYSITIPPRKAAKV